MNFTREHLLKKLLCFAMRSRRRDDFIVARIFFSEAGLVKWTRRKKTQTLENKVKRLHEENQQKRALQSNTEYSIGSRRYRTHQKSLGQSPCYHCRVLQFFTELFSSLDSLFLPAWYDSCRFINDANFRSLTRWWTFIVSSLFSLFRTGQCLLRSSCLFTTK